MASYATFECETCGFTFEATGPHECLITTKNDEKQIEKLPHPGLSIANAIVVNGFCPDCGKDVECIVAEFELPGNPWKQPLKLIKEEYRKNYSCFVKDHPKRKTVYTECFNDSSLRCPDCGKQILYHPSKEIICPQCEKGSFKVVSLFRT